MYRNAIRDIPGPNKYQKNIVPPRRENRFDSILTQLYSSVSVIQALEPHNRITKDDIVQIRNIIISINFFLTHHTSIAVLRPPRYFPAHKLILIRDDTIEQRVNSRRRRFEQIDP